MQPIDQLRGRREFGRTTFAVRLHRVNIRVGSAERTYGVIDHVAFDRVRAAVRNDVRGLVWQVFCWVDDFVLDRNFVANVSTMLDLFNVPDFFCHMSLQL